MYPDETVLVAILNNPRDLMIARDWGWYRIPVQHAPKQLFAEYLAFYQTKAFGDEGWAIRYYARIAGHELARRRDLLPDEPDHPHADEVYYKLQLGPLRELPHPITSRSGRRITFFTTTWGRLTQAREINELFRGTPQQESLWHALCEARIAADRQWIVAAAEPAGRAEDTSEVREGRADYALDCVADFAIFCENGMLAIQTGAQAMYVPPGWSALYLSDEQIEHTLADCIASIRAAIGQMGGLSKSKGQFSC